MGRINQISTTVQAILRFIVSQCLPEAADHSGPQRPYGCETKFTSRTKHHVTIISKNYVTKLLCLFGYCKFTSTTMSIYLCEKSPITFAKTPPSNVIPNLIGILVSLSNVPPLTELAPESSATLLLPKTLYCCCRFCCTLVSENAALLLPISSAS